MLLRIIVLMTLAMPLFADSTMSANLPIAIINLDSFGDCMGDDFGVIEDDGEYYFAAFFTDMDAVADNQVKDMKRCILKYLVVMGRNYKLDLLDFFVDGDYQLSDHGTARLSISHRIENHGSVHTKKMYSAENGDLLSGNFADFSGAILSEQLPQSYGQCGAGIPLTTSIYSEAVKPPSDLSGLSRISLDSNNDPGSFVKLGAIRVIPCL